MLDHDADDGFGAGGADDDAAGAVEFGLGGVYDCVETFLAGAFLAGEGHFAVAFGHFAVDLAERGEGWDVFVSGGRINMQIDAVEWAKEVERRGAGEILLTSMDGDGTQDGYDIALTRAISDAVGIPVIASGGAGRPSHFADALTEGGAAAALAASLFHFRQLSIMEVKEYLLAADIPVRIPPQELL